MNFFRTTTLTIGATAALLATTLVFTPSAQAAEMSPLSTPAPALTSDLPTITHEQLDSALEEAKVTGYVTREVVNNDGSRTTTLDIGGGFVFDITREAAGSARLGAGSDSYGAFVSFNAFDQSAIINGAGYGLTAGLCVLSAGTFCLVAGAIIQVATMAITANGGVQCGTKALRVYPFSGHKPRCA